MSKAISVGHDVRGGEKLIPSHKPFHQCHALLNYHQPVSGAIWKWPLPNPDGEKGLSVLMLTNGISMST